VTAPELDQMMKKMERVSFGQRASSVVMVEKHVRLSVTEGNLCDATLRGTRFGSTTSY
jgi:hypothetical protein